ncbi:choice-of-anchor J domain-containing protein, partial [bacterium]|nr:choice-of-anchor J domain-containing protein [bacterium]
NSDDEGRLQVSVEGGDWETISGNLIDGTSAVWTQYVADLSQYANSSVQLGFLFTSDPFDVDNGWYIDDVSIEQGPAGFRNPEDFELGVGNWSADNGLWEVGVPGVGPPAANSGKNVAGTVLNGNYPDHANTRFISPEITLTTQTGRTPLLCFWHWFRNTDDEGRVQISANGGPWETISNLFEGTSVVWTQVCIDLAAYEDLTVRIAFLFTSDPFDVDNGWYIDDVRIDGIPPNACIKVDPTSPPFGSVRIGAENVAPVTVSNCGTTTLNVNSIHISGPDATNFGVDTDSFTLDPNQSRDLSVHFRPDEGRTFTATLEINSNGGNVNVSLSGNGIIDGCPAPSIASITDVPNDQGKQVTVLWNRACPDTAASEQPIRFYGVWRRTDQISAAKASLATNAQAPMVRAIESFEGMMAEAHSATPGISYRIKSGTISSASEIWTFVGAAPALQFKQYAFDAPTLFDSTVVTGMYRSVFFVSAHTDDALIWYASPPDSGYSVDNLIPTAPTKLVATEGISKSGLSAVQLTWDESSDEDFDYFAVVRGSESGFDAKTAEPVAKITEPTFMDEDVDFGDVFYYRVVAFDFSGNQGALSNEVRALVTSVADDPDLQIPTEFALRQNHPNPFNPKTSISYRIPKAGHIRLVIYNVLGEKVRSLVDEQIPAGKHHIKWDARNDAGQQVSNGVYVYQMTSGEFVETKKMILLR